jgi:hypothetical protein
MDRKLAITAIAESDVESTVAQTLGSQGWQVIFRARTLGELQRFLAQDREEKIHLFTTYSINTFDTRTPLTIVPIDTKNFKALGFDINSSIRAIQADPVRLHYPRTQQLVGVATSGSSPGGSTLALNFAQECADAGRRVLYVDGSCIRPFATYHLEKFGVTRAVLPTELGFSIFELSQSESPELLKNCIGEFDLVLVDCGDLGSISSAISSARIDDYAMRWVLENGSHLIAISSERDLHRSQLEARCNEVKQLAPKIRIELILNQIPPLGRKERAVLKSDRTISTAGAPALFSRDNRAVVQAENERSTLARAASKSILRAEVAQYCREGNYWRN